MQAQCDGLKDRPNRPKWRPGRPGHIYATLEPAQAMDEHPVRLTLAELGRLLDRPVMPHEVEPWTR